MEQAAGRCSCRAVTPLPFHRTTTGTSPFLGTTVGLCPRSLLLLLPAPAPSRSSNTAMDLPVVPLLQQQLDTALQLIISLSSMMTTDEILMIKVRLAEADVLLARMLIEQGTTTAGGELIPILLLLLLCTQFVRVGHVEQHAVPTVVPQNDHTTNGNSRNRSSVSQASTHRRTVGHPTTSNNPIGQGSPQRPVTRSATRRDSAIRSLASSHRTRNTRTPLIEIMSDDD